MSRQAQWLLADLQRMREADREYWRLYWLACVRHRAAQLIAGYYFA